ncbi:MULTISPECIES: DNA/RNA non-specific endonuclease [unclassified Cupriavidus]|uniref:DNA/RNA non-specific endonuclease n=1 Tax=unclassified Cupriavidus TaxID=2640874 RepID=UPI00313BAB9F
MLTVKMKSVLAAVMLAAPLAAWGAATNCPDNYASGFGPEILHDKLAKDTVELCSAQFGVRYSSLTRTPLWSAENLSPGRFSLPRDFPRYDVFYEEKRIPSGWRATLEDYKGSGLDRGHLTPSADASNPHSDFETFALSNIVPQSADGNRNAWAAIEKAVRALARHRQVFVITGPLFIAEEGKPIRWLKRRVAVPSHIYKVVYDPASNAGGAYVLENEDFKRPREVSILELEQLARIRFFPDAASIRPMKLPRPRWD